MQVNFLGQTIGIGQYTGFPNGATALISAGSAFGVLSYFMDNYEDFGTPRVVIFKNHNNENTFALGVQQTDNYGLRCFWKWATSTSGLIPEDDTIPTVPPWNGWIMCGTSEPSYGGFDPENVTIDDLFLNSFQMYAQETNLYPYYSGDTHTSYTAEQCRDYATVNLIITDALRNWDGTTVVNYDGATPIEPAEGGSFTNWKLGAVMQPSYYIGTIGRGAEYVYSPLDIEGAWEADHFDEDPSGPGGVYAGDYGYQGDPFTMDDPISKSAVNTGFLTLWSPTSGQLIDLADYLWSSDFVDNLKKLYRDPFEAIIMFGILPCDLSSIRDSIAAPVVIGNVSTGVSMFKLSSQYYKKSFGYISVSECFGTCNDYEPFSTCQIYLPFIGFVPAKANEIINSRVYLTYYVDCLSGDCIAKIAIVKNTGNQNEIVTYQHRGNCMISVPMTGANYSNFFTNFCLNPLSVAKGALSGVGGGVNAAAGVAGALAGAEDMDQQRSGNYGGSISAFCNRTPAIIISRPIQHYPADSNKYIGYPSFITYTLSSLSGYTQVADVIDNTVTRATDAERAEIEKALKDGVILP